jgi:hypothetical protein
MGIVNGFAFGMVFTVNRRPSTGLHASANPQPETKKVGNNRVKIKGTVGLVPVQVERDSSKRHLHKNKRVDHQPGDRKIEQTAFQEGN